jgi:DNA-directed RNA polymerase subunit K/omega
MNDFDKMRDNVGNRFDLVLVASERLRELHKIRKEQDEQMKYSGSNPSEYLFERRKHEIPTKVTFNEIESGVVGREYLNKIKERKNKYRQKKSDLLM